MAALLLLFSLASQGLACIPWPPCSTLGRVAVGGTSRTTNIWAELTQAWMFVTNAWREGRWSDLRNGLAWFGALREVANVMQDTLEHGPCGTTGEP